MQDDLFQAAPVAGLLYRPDFLSPGEEQELVARIAALDFAAFQFRGYEGKRRVVSFGWRYDFNDLRLSEAPPIPGFLRPLHERAASWLGTAPESMPQVLVTEYRPGAGIGWHRDRPVFDEVVGVSLQAPCTMRLRRRRADGFDRASLALARRSAYALTGVVRREWEHSIAPMDALRYSITFRSLAAQRK